MANGISTVCSSVPAPPIQRAVKTLSQALLQNLNYCLRDGALLGLMGINAPLNIYALMRTFNRIRIIVAQLSMQNRANFLLGLDLPGTIQERDLSPFYSLPATIRFL